MFTEFRIWKKTCTFFGHRKIFDSDKIKKQLIELIGKLIRDKGFTVFLFGGFGEFDSLCYEIVSDYKSRYENIKRIYYAVDKSYFFGRKHNSRMLPDYEETIYPDLEFDYWYTRIYFRNCEMIKNSDFAIFYADSREDSGAYKILKYAKKIKKDFINLYR